MAEELHSLHIDNDWKKQAQEEKRRLADEAQKRQTAAPTAPPPVASSAAAVAPGRTAAASPRGRRAPREIPPASFASLVQSVLTQALYHLGELAPAGGEGSVNLDMAKHHLDTLGILEQKTANNLDDTEKQLLDTALYESRARFVSTASQFI